MKKNKEEKNPNNDNGNVTITALIFIGFVPFLTIGLSLLFVVLKEGLFGLPAAITIRL